MSPLAHLRPDRQRLLDTFSLLARLDSPSRQEAPVARFLVPELQRLGWHVGDDASGPDCGNIIATLPGDEALEPLMFTSHMDVVMPCLGVRPRAENDVIASAGDTVLGADAKASVAAMLELASLLASNSAPDRRPPLEMVFTWGEEIGHLGAKALDISRLRARRAYVLDGLTPVGTIIVAAPSYYAVSIRVVGRAAHAGVEPEHGVSAIAVAALALSRLPWGRLDESTTANVGTIDGGTARNAVPAEVKLEGEVRGHTSARAEHVAQAIQTTFESVAAEAGARAEVKIDRLYADYELSQTDPVVAQASRAFATIAGGGALEAGAGDGRGAGEGRGVSRLVRSGGGSDANELNAVGITACVLGIGAEHCHSVQERITLTDLELLTAWILELVNQAASTGKN